MNSSALILDLIEFHKKNVYKIRLLTHDGEKIWANACISKFELENGDTIKGVNFDSSEIGIIAARNFVDLRGINAAILAFHEAQSNIR